MIYYCHRVSSLSEVSFVPMQQLRHDIGPVASSEWAIPRLIYIDLIGIPRDLTVKSVTRRHPEVKSCSQDQQSSDKSIRALVLQYV